MLINTSLLITSFCFSVKIEMKFLLPFCLMVGVCLAKELHSPTAKRGSDTQGDHELCVTVEQRRGRCVKPNECGDENIPRLPFGGVFSKKTLPTCHYLKICCPKKLVLTQPKAAAPVRNVTGCGWSNPGVGVFNQSRPDYADYGEFPWIVAIIRRSNDTSIWTQRDYFGAGSLIHPSVVMTTAYEVHRRTSDEVTCRAGEWDTQTNNELYPHQQRNVDKIIIHPNFLVNRGHNNIALLILDSPFDLSAAPHVGVACLGRSLPPAGTACFSMGWGLRNFNNKDEYAVLLRKIPLPLVDRSACEVSLRTSSLGPRYRLHGSMTCAGGKRGPGACIGDGGAPLVCPIPNDPQAVPRYAVFGLTAFGSSCGAALPSVYTLVPHEHGWITTAVAEEGFDTNSFMY